MKREIIYDIFLECNKHTDDAYWQYIFEDLAYGKAPYGSNISKNFIYSNYKGKEFSYKIEEKDPKIIFEELYNIFSKKLGLSSIKDKSKLKLNNKTGTSIENLNWTSIKKKCVKDFIIENYVIDMMKLYFLSVEQAKYLLSIINIAFIFKKINHEDIIFKDGKILKIHGINFKNNKILYSLKLFNFISI